MFHHLNEHSNIRKIFEMFDQNLLFHKMVDSL